MKDHLDMFTNKVQPKNEEEQIEHIDLSTFITKFIKQKEKELAKPKTGNKNNTVKSYDQTLKHLSEFKKSTGYIVDFNTIDGEFYSADIHVDAILSYAWLQQQSLSVCLHSECLILGIEPKDERSYCLL